MIDTLGPMVEEVAEVIVYTETDVPIVEQVANIEKSSPGVNFTCPRTVNINNDSSSDNDETVRTS